MSVGLTSKETRGVLIFLIIVSIIVGGKYFYEHIEREKSAALLMAQLDTLNIDTPMPQLFEFDPNTVELPELMKLGLEKREAVSIIRYREYGKVFRIKEDLFTCYGISDSLYYALEPYIVIGEEYKIKRREEYSSYPSTTKRTERKLLAPSEFMIDTVDADYLYAIGALSRRQAEVFLKWRDMSGMHSIEDVRECYVVSDSIADVFERYVIFTPLEKEEARGLVDINKADSAELCTVYGIGEKTASAIVDYRKKLGGFYSANQLSEIKLINESNFEKILQQILCDSCDISKIDVNFAPAKEIYGHPYIAPRVLRRLLKIRELKGGWSKIEEMITDDILTEEEATRLRPYLLFEEVTTQRRVNEFF